MRAARDREASDDHLHGGSRFRIVFTFAAVPARCGWPKAPQWTVTSVSRATNFKPGDETGDDSYLVTVTNTGDASSNGDPIAVTDELPEGLSLDPAGASGEDPLAREGKGACPSRVQLRVSHLHLHGRRPPR